jgi:hypothetical protein
VLFPTANATSSGPQHTFTWTKPTVTPKQLFVSLQRWDVPSGLYLTESYFGSSAPTSWTVHNLAEGLYQFRLEFNSMTQPIPMTATLLSGPDAGPFTANISWRQQSGTFFTVVPEPAIGGMLAGGTLLAALCRRR